jgi:ribonuclease HII
VGHILRSFLLKCDRWSESMSEPVVRGPTLDEERELWQNGYRFVAGLDEVGRGAWAGPVFAAAVILPCSSPDVEVHLSRVRDSKQLSPQQRNNLVAPISEMAVAVSLAQVSCEDVDRLGIVGATRLAMRVAIDGLPLRPDYLLIDALQLPQVLLPQKAIIKGDALCLSISAASIIAKVARDRLLVELDSQYPGYGFAHHKGYGTPEHRRALERLGLCPIHRRSYRPVRDLLGFTGIL